jgi:hypothetical protein
MTRTIRNSAATLLVVATLLGHSNIASVQAETEALLQVNLDSSSLSVEVPNQESNGLELSGGMILTDRSDYQVSVGAVSVDSLQLLINIENNNSPDYFDFAIPEAFAMEKVSFDGFEMYKLLDEYGATVAWLAPPWAKDQLGVRVQTQFKFQDGVLRQYVDHKSIDAAYPVIADPYLGIALISDMDIRFSQGSYILSIAVTPWVGVIYAGGLLGVPLTRAWSYGFAYSVMAGDGWTEVLSVAGSKFGGPFKQYVATRATYRNQWNCHAAGAPAIFVGELLGDPNTTWDLEGYRTSTTNTVTWATTRCNW